ncbi:MAG: GlsB/YeaQ/YmgE family stress response membrane protein [Erysipelothrix sp.]|nr:GlsB/YeaQ/YmgE family stress response membrane protein [Erysipelothrix sp.]
MSPENILVWIIVGGIAGWLSSKLVGTQGGLVTNIIVGILGSFIGGWIFTTTSQTAITGINLTSIGIATIGSLILLAILKLVNR